MDEFFNTIWNCLIWIGCILFGSTIIIIGLCALTIILSMAIDCVTGFDLIREVIRPFFQRLR